MTEYQTRIVNKLKSVPVDTMTAEERAVMAILFNTLTNGTKVTQNEIARTERWMGCHPKHEADIMSNKLETTTRQVRQIINDLRNKYFFPILSDDNGYWLSRSQEDATEYIEKLERQARATSAAFFTTYQSMKQALNVENKFFESLEIVL